MATVANVGAMAPASGLLVALESVFTRSQGELLGMLYHLLGSWDDAHACLQEAFHKCWQTRHEITRPSRIRPWVFRIALEIGRTHQTKVGDRARASQEALEVDVPTLRSKLQRDVRQQIMAMQPLEREIFLLKENGELPFDEIADLLQLPVDQVKQQMRSAVRRLRSLAPSPN